MAKGTWAATAANAELVAANAYRGSVIVQLLSGDPTSLAFGEAAVFDEGVQLRAVGDAIEVRGYQATLAVYGICDTANTSSGGYQES